MSEKTKKIVYLVYGIIQSLLLAICGGYLIAACLAVYDGGNGVFSREAVTAQFDQITIPVILCLVGVVIGAVLTVALPRETKKIRGEMDSAAAIKKLSARLDTQACPPRYTSLMKKEQTLRLILRLVATALCLILAIPCLIYLFNLSHFDDIGAGLTSDITAAMVFVLPAAVEGLGAWIVVTFGCHDSYQRELSLLKDAIKAAPLKGAAKAEVNTNSNHAVWIIRAAVLLVAVVFIVLGIVNGGMEDVLQKAIRICTECIGLG